MGYYSSIQGISAFIGASILVLIFIFGSVHTRRKGTFQCSLVSEWGRGVQNGIKPMMNPMELPLLDQTILNPGISTTPNDLSNELVQTLQFMTAPLQY